MYCIIVNQIDDFEAFVEFANKVGQFTTELLGGGSGKKKETSIRELCRLHCFCIY